MNVHDLVPPLSKRGTLFRPSRATIDQRGAEFAALMRGLFNPDPEAPVLLRELRNSQAVRDFFAYWRRDKETAERYGPKMKHSNRSLSSILSSNVHEQEYPPLPSPPPSAPPPTTPLTPGHMAEAPRINQHTLARDPQPSHQTHGDNPRPVTTPQPPAVQPANRSFPVSYDHYSRPSQPERMIFTDRGATSFHPVDSWQRRDSVPNIATINTDAEIGSHPPPPQRPPLPKSPPPRRFSNADTREPPLRPRSNSSTAHDHRNVYPHGAEPHPALPVRKPDGQSSQLAYNRSLHSFPSSPSLKSPSSSNVSQTPSISSRFSNMSLNRSSVNSSISGYTYASKSSQQGDALYDGDFDHDDDSAVLSPSSPLSSHRTPLSDIAEDRPTPSHHGYRASITSIRTEVSADGVLPPHLREAWGLDDEHLDSYPTGELLI